MQRKIFIYVMSVLLITLAVSGYFTEKAVSELYISNIEEKLICEGYILGKTLSECIVSKDISNMQKLLEDVSRKLNVRVTVIDNTGTVLGETSYDISHMTNHLERPEIQEALKGELGKETRYSTTMKADLLYIAQPVYKGESIVGIVRLSTPLKEIKGIMRNINNSIYIALIPGLVLSLFLIYRMSISITKPIKKIKNVAVEITQGKLDRATDIIGTDEIGQLAKSIDFMAASIRDKINSINDKSIKMESILSSVMNGIIAVDSNENILFINPMAKQMLCIKETNISGKHLLKVVRNSKIDNMVKSILDDSSVGQNEIIINIPEERIYKLYSNIIKYPDSKNVLGIIIVIQDITDIRKLESIRSEFVANVSHELKTPLTSIKGFVETLKAGAIEDEEASMRFLNIIEDEADRLSRLISDIMSLSELENKKLHSRVEQIDTASKIMEVLSILQNQANKKNIKLSANIAPDIKQLRVDSDQFKQMLINLVDNGIKYTSEGGQVEVNAYNLENNIIIKIKDNGIGISKEQIPRIFERFYRVDKARSRDVGGTGLGLAIVKHIVMQLRGSIKVYSELGKGTEFVLTIPVE